MSLIPERLRPYLAGTLGIVAVGLGQLYLRRWLRGLGWLVLAFVVSELFVSPEAVQATAEAVRATMAGGTPAERAPLSAIYPMVSIQLAAALDAFLLAYRETTGSAGVDPDVDVPVVGDDGAAAETVSCPNCGKEVDADLGFCHWCTTEFATPEN